MNFTERFYHKFNSYLRVKRLQYGYNKKILKLIRDTKPPYLDNKTKKKLKPGTHNMALRIFLLNGIDFLAICTPKHV